MQAMKSAPSKRAPAVIRVRHRRLQQAMDCDVAVCGGTLGLLLALGLQVSASAHFHLTECLQHIAEPQRMKFSSVQSERT